MAHCDELAVDVATTWTMWLPWWTRTCPDGGLVLDLEPPVNAVLHGILAALVLDPATGPLLLATTLLLIVLLLILLLLVLLLLLLLDVHHEDARKLLDVVD